MSEPRVIGCEEPRARAPLVQDGRHCIVRGWTHQSDWLIVIGDAGNKAVSTGEVETELEVIRK